MLHMSAQCYEHCYEHRFGYCTNAKTCLNVRFRPILAERRVLLGSAFLSAHTQYRRSTVFTVTSAIHDIVTDARRHNTTDRIKL